MGDLKTRMGEILENWKSKRPERNSSWQGCKARTAPLRQCTQGCPGWLCSDPMHHRGFVNKA